MNAAEKRLENTRNITLCAGVILTYWSNAAKTHQWEWIILCGLCFFFAALDEIILLHERNKDPNRANPLTVILVVVMAALMIVIPFYTGAQTIRYFKAVNNISYSLKDGTGIVRQVYGGDPLVEVAGTWKDKPVKVIGKSAFAARRAEKIILPETITEIRDNAFYGCASLKEIALPEGVTSIGKNAFHGCKALTELVLPESVVSIGKSAFSRCGNLKHITIPASVREIPKSAFNGCPKDLVIAGEPGSAAQEYAERYFTFEQR